MFASPIPFPRSSKRPLGQPWGKTLGMVLLNLGCWVGLPSILTPAAWSAEKISLYVGPLEFPLAVESLEIYAQDGEIRPDFATYARRFNEEQLAQLRELLVTRADVTPVAVAQFFYSPQGEIILKELGELIQTRSRQSGFYAIRSALILAAADRDGLTPLNVLKKFPTSNIRINSDRAFELIEQASQIIQNTERAIVAIETASLEEIASTPPTEFPLDLRQGGTIHFKKQTLTLNDRPRDRIFFADLYLPKTDGRAPLIVISHGFGSSRESYQYLAIHLASYGFAVAVPEHPGSNAEQLEALANGLAKDITPPRELIDRPLDIKFLLDELERNYSQQVDWQKVGVVGQSFGAYTALALAGAELNFEDLSENCSADNPSINLSFLIQCQMSVLPREQYNLGDERVAAAIAINPITSVVFGPTNLGRLDIPLALVSGSADAVAPALDEQIRPFTALTVPERYLILLQGGTHFSTIGPTSQDVPLPAQVVGPDPAIARDYIKAIALAFFQTHIAGALQYQPYLSAAYAQTLSQKEMPLTLVGSLNPDKLE